LRTFTDFDAWIGLTALEYTWVLYSIPASIVSEVNRNSESLRLVASQLIKAVISFWTLALVIDVLQAVLKSLILFNLAGIEASTGTNSSLCEAAEVAGVPSVIATWSVDAVVANLTEFPEDVMVLVPAPEPGPEAVGPPEGGSTPTLSAQVGAPEVVVPVGMLDCDTTSDAVVVVGAAEVVVMGFIGMGFWGVVPFPRFGIPRPTPSVRSWAEVWFNPAKVWSSPVKSKFAWDWSKATDSSWGDFAAGEAYSDELVLEDESWPSAGSP
jgi:hypothetical protein